jgi:hypothetical protein
MIYMSHCALYSSATPETAGFITYTVPEQDFSLTLTQEAHQIVRSAGWLTTRKAIEAALTDALTNPHGELSIDQYKDTDAGRTARTVHRLPAAIEERLGLPVAVKGTGLDVVRSIQMGLGSRANLTDQFHFMHRLYAAQQKYHPGGIGGVLSVNRPLGLIKHSSNRPGQHTQEWLLMDRVVDAQPVEEMGICMTSGDIELAFDAHKYPDLAAIADPYGIFRDDDILFEDLATKVGEQLAPDIFSWELGDVVGHNILAQQRPDGRNTYILIDAQPNR